MPTYQYKALNAQGQATQGSLEAAGRQEAMRLVEARGLKPVRLVEAGGGSGGGKSGAKTGGAALLNSGGSGGFGGSSGGGFGGGSGGFRNSSGSGGGSGSLTGPASPTPGNALFGGKKKVSFEALEDFTRSLSSLLAASVPLSRALKILCTETANPVAAEKWRELHDHVIDGMALGAAMARSPEVFPRIYVAMVEAGEAGGFLDVVLNQIADFQARDKEIRGKVMSAMIYPAALLTLAVFVVIFLMVFFIPRFQTLFANAGSSLPVITQVIVATSDALRHYGLYILAGVVAAGYFVREWFAQEENRRVVENVLLKAPVLGPLAALVAMARFCRMLGTLLGAGVPLMTGLTVARRSLGYQTLIDLVADSTDRVSKGETLAGAMADCRVLFPGSMLEMIAVAEESGRLDKELVRLAGVTETTLDRQLRNAVALAEPLLLVLIAAVIGVLFIGMILPIFSIQDSIK